MAKRSSELPILPPGVLAQETLLFVRRGASPSGHTEQDLIRMIKAVAPGNSAQPYSDNIIIESILPHRGRGIGRFPVRPLTPGQLERLLLIYLEGLSADQTALVQFIRNIQTLQPRHISMQDFNNDASRELLSKYNREILPILNRIISDWSYTRELRVQKIVYDNINGSYDVAGIIAGYIGPADSLGDQADGSKKSKLGYQRIRSPRRSRRTSPRRSRRTSLRRSRRTSLRRSRRHTRKSR